MGSHGDEAAAWRADREATSDGPDIGHRAVGPACHHYTEAHFLDFQPIISLSLPLSPINFFMSACRRARIGGVAGE